MKNEAFLDWGRGFIAEQKTRFDWGLQFLVFVNFALLVVTASDKLRTIIPVGTDTLLLVLLPSAFFCTWLLGFFLDKYAKLPHHQSRVLGDRSPHLIEIIERLKRIEERQC